MINSKLDHCKTVEEFYESIRSQQEAAHGADYCKMHDAINELAILPAIIPAAAPPTPYPNTLRALGITV